MNVLNTFKESAITSTGENTTEANDDGVKDEEGDNEEVEEEEDILSVFGCNSSISDDDSSTSDDESCYEDDGSIEEDEMFCEQEYIMCQQSEQDAAAIDNIDNKKLELFTDAARKLLSADATSGDSLKEAATLQIVFASEYNKIKEVSSSSIKEALEPISKVCSRYTGQLDEDKIEVFTCGRISTGTEGHNSGLSQEVGIRASISHVVKTGHFKLPLVLHPTHFVSIDKRKHPEKMPCPYGINHSYLPQQMQIHPTLDK